MSEPTTIKIRDEELLILPDRALYWPRRRALIIADPHFGKASSFRQAGVPIPVGSTLDDLARLDILLEKTSATRLVVLGDFFHHRTGQCPRTMASLAEWRVRNADLEILIVMGNHDEHSEAPPAEWNVRFERTSVSDAPFLYCHEPCGHPNFYVLAGHIHPSIMLRDPVGHSLRIPCFQFSERYALLPAFGGFTGSATIRPTPGDIVYGIVDGETIRVPVSQ